MTLKPTTEAKVYGTYGRFKVISLVGRFGYWVEFTSVDGSRVCLIDQRDYLCNARGLAKRLWAAYKQC